MVLVGVSLVICVSFGDSYFQAVEADLCVLWYSFAMECGVACVPTCDVPFNDCLSETSSPPVDRKFTFIKISTLGVC